MAKRITIFAGHYGSGKTNVAVNFALKERRVGKEVVICDLDIVNPYFRTKDSAEDLRLAGIELISSEYANSNVDIPALPPAMYAVVDDRSRSFVLDVGGDDRGALALGRLTPRILEENDYEMLLVVNFFRPLTASPEALLEIMHEVEAAAGMRFTGIVNNSNLGEETTAEHVLSTLERVKDFSRLSKLPVVFTSVKNDLVDALKGKVESLFPLELQKKYY
ncbi:MAG: hypothetical protein IKC69_00935 [Clostridia bacterium]|nr:hypothetical protein [Clostridia bacterium]